MKKLSILALALSILAVSCNKEAGKGDPGGAAGEIRVSATVNGITKATTQGAVTTFDDGDQLSLYVWTGDNTAVPASPWINGEVNTYNWETKKWNPANLMLWQNGTDAHYFLGVFPARAITNFTADPYEQTGNYGKDDLLVGTILGDGVKPSVAPVPLTMDHLMAQLKVTLTLRNQWSGDPEVHVLVKAAATGTVDYLSKTITPGNDIVTFGFGGLGEGFQSTLIIPQEGVKEITVTVNGTKYVYTHPTSIPLTKGHVTTLPLVVGKDAIVLADEGITFEEWTAGELPEGLGGDAVVAPKVTDLGTITADYVAQNGYTLTGTLNVENYPVKISIAKGATVTLDGVTINGANNSSFQWAGLNCEGNATIILKDGTTNTVKGFYENWAGIYVPEGCTLTIQGQTLSTGKLIASSNGYGCGIGGGWGIACGNINIEGGDITATGGKFSAGIGGGGTNDASCGDITITSGVTKVTATKGSGATNSIGAGRGTCGTVTIGGVVGAISDSPYVYPLPYPIDLSEVTSAYVGSVISTSDGTKWNVYKTKADALAATETPIAIIAYVGAPGTVEASDANFKGLAIALSDAYDDICEWAVAPDGLEYCVSGGVDVDLNAALNLINGKACTNTLEAHTAHAHAAAVYAKKNNDTPHPEDATTWFLPSMGQWNLIVKGLATKKAGSAVTTDLTQNDNATYKASNLNSVITDAGGTGFEDADYWSSTEYDDVGAWCIKLGRGMAAKYGKGSENHVRAAFAF